MYSYTYAPTYNPIDICTANIHLVFVTRARVVCLVCAPQGPGAGGVHVGYTMSAHVINAM